jgi:A/G-specific adenine glycosylase
LFLNVLNMKRSTRLVRHSSSKISNEISSMRSPAKIKNDENSPEPVRTTDTKKRAASASESDAYESSASEKPKPTTKKRKVVRSAKRGNGNAQIFERLFSNDQVTNASLQPCSLPVRNHTISYHRPLLLDKREGRASLLTWFDTVSSTRGMPWRKAWIDPSATPDPAELRQLLERRAYEVWISEIMLQQTRVAAVIDYWNRWMAKWPNIHDLAAAEPDDVLAAWRGLGYYSRATRIHEGAKLVCKDPAMKGLLPADVAELEAKVPGVGRYTAGAISAIVFGKAAPMVDGNVLRVLSRQLGLFGDVKTDKAVIDMLWSAASALAKAVAKDSDEGKSPNSEEPEVNDGPGRWGQALMELGSTVCTPKPNCGACPISSTCHAYGEGFQLAVKKGLVSESSMLAPRAAADDIEDACSFCTPFEEFAPQDEEDEEITKTTKSTVTSSKKKSQSKKQASLESFFFTPSTKSKKPVLPPTEPDSAALELITNHARKFPIKTIKKAVRVEETLVCAVRRSDGRYLIHRRPEKGLLAGLWEFPSYILPDSNDSTAKARKGEAQRYVTGLISSAPKDAKRLKYIGELGSVPWLFSHLKLTMHVHLFELGGADSGSAKASTDNVSQSRWSDDVDEESMGTGMRKCWTLIQESAANGLL